MTLILIRRFGTLSINYNTDTGLDVVFDLLTVRVFTVTSTRTFIRVRKTRGVGTHTHTGLLYTPFLYINQRRQLVLHLCLLMR